MTTQVDCFAGKPGRWWLLVGGSAVQLGLVVFWQDSWLWSRMITNQYTCTEARILVSALSHGYMLNSETDKMAEKCYYFPCLPVVYSPPLPQVF